jgi:ParB family chromosome partitioning protein
MTMARDTRKAHGAAGKTDMLLFDPEELFLVTDEASDLYDERVNLEPTEAFVSNLEHYGVLEPILVRKNTQSGKTEVVDGRQRVKGLRVANKLLKKKGLEPWRIAAVVKRADAGNAIGMMISANEQRAADDPLNLARKAARMLERGKTEEEVGLALGRSISSVKNLIKILDAPAVVRRAVEAGKITVSDGYKLAGLEVEDAKKKVEALIEHAPRTPGKKRSKNAKRAREIVGGGKPPQPPQPQSASKERESHQMENVKRDLEELGDTLGDDGGGVGGALLVLRWYFGEIELPELRVGLGLK